MSQPTDTRGEIRYDLRARRPRLAKWIAGLVVVVLAWTVVRDAARGASPMHYVIPAFFAVLFCISSTRTLNTVVVNRQGIRRPTRRFIPWSQVEAVHQSKYSDLVSLHLVGGRDCSTGLPAEYAERVVQIGNVPLS
ncbi:hypothetical protein HNR15_002593 [Allobranchiibius huperziae]|uniref:Uncharacterized protein n=1 Tax=Allobranchiibius huperziae TaxID=1874116 RepID=A0A853DLX1_9MICO|nr:hypothetical protein [Allobranchiibius huperziae]